MVHKGGDGAMLQGVLEMALSARDARWVHRVLELMFEAQSAPSAVAIDLIRAQPLDSVTKASRKLLAAFDRLAPE